MSLRERLVALVGRMPPSMVCNDWQRDQVNDLAIVAARLALEDAARECDGKRYWTGSMCAARIRALAQGLDK